MAGRNLGSTIGMSETAFGVGGAAPSWSSPRKLVLAWRCLDAWKLQLLAGELVFLRCGGDKLLHSK